MKGCVCVGGEGTLLAKGQTTEDPPSQEVWTSVVNPSSISLRQCVHCLLIISKSELFLVMEKSDKFCLGVSLSSKQTGLRDPADFRITLFCNRKVAAEEVSPLA